MLGKRVFFFLRDIMYFSILENSFHTLLQATKVYCQWRTGGRDGLKEK